MPPELSQYLIPAAIGLFGWFVRGSIQSLQVTLDELKRAIQKLTEKSQTQELELMELKTRCMMEHGER